MVLSNKKLKQRIRSLLAESVAAAESGKRARDDPSEEGAKKQLQSLVELRSSKNSRRPRPATRAGKKNNPSSAEASKPAEVGAEEREEGRDALEINANKIKSGKKKKKKKDTKKRERGESVAKREKEEKQQKKKSKKDREGKDNPKVEKNEDECGRADGGETTKAVETAAIYASEEHSDATRKVYVGGIPYYSTEDDIRSFFDSCGTVTEVDCMTFPESGKFRGIAILTYKTEAAAKRALALDGADMGGLYLKIQPYKASRAQRTDFSPEVVAGYNRIYVGNLSWDITEDDLRKFFASCKIVSIRFGEDKETGEFKGYAHVDFEDSPSLAAAIELDQTMVCGRPARIRCAVPKKEVGTKQKPPATKADASSCMAAASGSGKKKKRQTCYECGVPGHLSSSCPQKKDAAAAIGSS